MKIIANCSISFLRLSAGGFHFEDFHSKNFVLLISRRNHRRPLILTDDGYSAFPVVFHAVISPVTPVAWLSPFLEHTLTLLCECPYNSESCYTLILVTSTRVLLIINIWRSAIRGITEQCANWKRISDSSWRRALNGTEIILSYVRGSFRNVINVIRVCLMHFHTTAGDVKWNCPIFRNKLVLATLWKMEIRIASRWRPGDEIISFCHVSFSSRA